MVRKLITLDSWPSPEHSAVARALAHGMTWQRAAESTGVPIATLSRWVLLPEMQTLITDLREELRDTQEPQFQRSIDLSQQILLGALAGDFAADDPRVLLAERVLARTLHRIIAMEARGSGRNVREEPVGLPYSASSSAT